VWYDTRVLKSKLTYFIVNEKLDIQYDVEDHETWPKAIDRFQSMGIEEILSLTLAFSEVVLNDYVTDNEIHVEDSELQDLARRQYHITQKLKQLLLQQRYVLGQNAYEIVKL
jgi:hypothetical protein